jgi:hypothetical protein
VTTIKYVDHGISCNECAAIVYCSQAGATTIAQLIKYLRKRGWSISIHRGQTAVDYCPAHSGRLTP